MSRVQMIIFLTSIILVIVIKAGDARNKGSYSCWRTNSYTKRFFFIYHVQRTKTSFPVFCDCTYDDANPTCTSVSRREYFKHQNVLEHYQREGASRCCGEEPTDEEIDYGNNKEFPTKSMKKNRVCFVDDTSFQFSVYDGANRHVCGCDQTWDSCYDTSEILNSCNGKCKKKFLREYKSQKKHCCGEKVYYPDCYGVLNNTMFKVRIKNRDHFIPDMHQLCSCPKEGSKGEVSFQENCRVTIPDEQEAQFQLSYKNDNYNCCKKVK